MKRPKLIITEGHRLTGKSTISKHLGNGINYATRINPTGFKEDGIEGRDKIVNYYHNWVLFLMSFKDTDTTFIFDRFLFSEIVYSRLYKSYNFNSFLYKRMLKSILEVADIELYVYSLDNEPELRSRMNRKKVLFSDVADDLIELDKQRKGYAKMVEELKEMNLEGLTITEVDVMTGTSEEHARNVINAHK